MFSPAPRRGYWETPRSCQPRLGGLTAQHGPPPRSASTTRVSRARVHAGDETAFEVLYDRHYRVVAVVLPAHAGQCRGRRGRAPADVPARPRRARRWGSCRRPFARGCSRSPATAARRSSPHGRPVGGPGRRGCSPRSTGSPEDVALRCRPARAGHRPRPLARGPARRAGPVRARRSVASRDRRARSGRRRARSRHSSTRRAPN